MEGRRRKLSADAQLHKVIVISSIVGTIVNCTVLLVSAVSGKWLFGHACCQIFGLLSQVLVAGSAWMIALAAVEGLYRYYIPTEHPSTFSEINIKILTYGIYLLLVVLHTGPLYGWGEYSNLRGNINLEVYITDFTSAKEEHNSSLNRFLLMTGNLGQNATCSIDNATAVQLQPDNVAGILSSVLKSMYKCDLRAKMDKVWTFLIRFASRSLPDMFVQEYNSGEMTQKIHEEFVTHFDGCNASFAKVQFEFILPTSKIGVYKDVHLSFQDIGLCSLDYSSTNAAIISWIPFVIVTSVIIPYSISLVTGVILKLSHLDHHGIVFLSPVCFIFGSILCLFATFPYYYVNILNYNDVPISHTVNISVTVLYFSHSVLFLIVCACYGCCRGNFFQITDIQASVSMSLVSLAHHRTKSHRQRNSVVNNV